MAQPKIENKTAVAAKRFKNAELVFMASLLRIAFLSASTSECGNEVGKLSSGKEIFNSRGLRSGKDLRNPFFFGKNR
jgi:hypothetical protein